VGCAGRGIKVAVELLRRLGVYKSGLDVVIYDVLGDVVCGGFGMPLRQGLAEDVYVVTSADYLAIYAANNICKGIERHAGRGGSALGGIVYNVRGSLDDLELVEEFAAKIGSKVTGSIPSDPLITESELYRHRVRRRVPGSREVQDTGHINS
jgi:nitrogenase iron protein NifH